MISLFSGKLNISGPHHKNMKLSRQVVVITGASSGIGMAVAKAFAKEGCSLLLAARRVDRLNEVAKVCRACGASCEVVEMDLQDHEQVLRCVDTAVKKYGRIDVLINNAGMGGYSLFHLQPWDTVQTTLRTNLEGTLALCHAVIPHMIRQKSGTIVNVSSVVGKRGVPLLAAYCASKFGLWGFSQALRLELQPHGIHVCHFCPTATATEFQQVAGMETSSGSPPGLDSPDRVAAAMVKAVVKKEREHIMSPIERILIKAHLLAPSFIDWLLELKRNKK
jgi:short-subunit dehydrogenase